MTTPTTSAVRAWARDNGFEIAERGRLPVEVTSAYAEAHRAGANGKATGRTTSPAAATANKPAASNGATRNGAAKPAAAKNGATKNGASKSPAGRSTPSKAPAAPVPAAEAPAAEAPESPAAPKPSPVTDDRRLVALGEELSALSERVAALEAAMSSGGKGRAIRFRRRS